MESAINARNTYGLFSDTTFLEPLLLPVVAHIGPLAHLIADYLRLRAVDVGDIIEVPDYTGKVIQGVILRKLSHHRALLAERAPAYARGEFLHFSGPSVPLVLVHFFGWSNYYDEMITINAVRTQTETYAGVRPLSGARKLDERVQWLVDDRWKEPTVFASWRQTSQPTDLFLETMRDGTCSIPYFHSKPFQGVF